MSGGHGQDAVVAPKGCLDAATAPILDRELSELSLGGGQRILVDLSQVT